MTRILLCCIMLFHCACTTQAASQTAPKPIIDNERVTVFDVTSAGSQPSDAVVVSAAGKAAFVQKGMEPKIDGRSFVIDLKNHPVAPIENKTGYPVGFPRPGSVKVLENDRVIVWDYTWAPGVPTPMHFHDKDVVVVFLQDGDLKSTSPDGKSVVNEYKAATVRFSPRDRTHTETLVRGQQRAIITELK